MVTRVIPQEEWAEFLDDLSDLDETVTASIEVLSNDLSDQFVARDLPLQGMTLVEKGSDAGEIEIILGDGPSDHFSQVIASPTKLSVVETEVGLPQTVQIESDSGPTMLVHLQVQADEDLEDEEADLEE